jgi:hypothetical protein
MEGEEFLIEGRFDELVTGAKAQAQGVTPQQQQAAAFFDLIATLARKRGAKRVDIASGPDGELSVSYDFEGLNGCDEA